MSRDEFETGIYNAIGCLSTLSAMVLEDYQKEKVQLADWGEKISPLDERELVARDDTEKSLEFLYDLLKEEKYGA